MLVKTQVKDFVKQIDGELRIGRETIDSLETVVKGLIRKGIERTKSNKRKTIKSQDI